MTTNNGSYEFRFYLTPDDILDATDMPEGFRVMTVAWQDERQAFCFLVEAPHRPEFFVPKYEVLPIQSPAVTRTIDESGSHISIRFPQFEDADAPQ